MPEITEVLAIVLNDCRAYLENYYYIGIKAGEVMVLLYCLFFIPGCSLPEVFGKGRFSRPHKNALCCFAGILLLPRSRYNDFIEESRECIRFTVDSFQYLGNRTGVYSIMDGKYPDDGSDGNLGFLFCKGIHRLLFIKGKDK